VGRVMGGGHVAVAQGQGLVLYRLK
jgi:hypothetical protein